MIICNGCIINLKCVCVYEMYVYDILDICKKIVLRENGSLDYVKGNISILLFRFVWLSLLIFILVVNLY